MTVLQLRVFIQAQIAVRHVAGNQPPVSASLGEAVRVCSLAASIPSSRVSLELISFFSGELLIQLRANAVESAREVVIAVTQSQWNACAHESWASCFRSLCRRGCKR